MTRLTLRRERLAELGAGDLRSVHGAAITGATCWQSLNCTQITVPTGCGLVCDVLNAVTDATVRCLADR